MNAKRATRIMLLSACLVALVAISLFATSAIAADKERSMSIIHESADILYYENGSPYIHDIFC